jgi:hypothetical protein
VRPKGADQGGSATTYRDVFTACLATPYPVWAWFVGGASSYKTCLNDMDSTGVEEATQ